MILKKIKPLGNAVLTTCDKYNFVNTIGNTSILDASKLEGSVKEYQTVLAVGKFVNNVAPGDVVQINPLRYQIRGYDDNSIRKDIVKKELLGYRFPIVEIDGKECMLLQEADMEFIIEDMDTSDETSSVLAYTPPEKSLIV